MIPVLAATLQFWTRQAGRRHTRNSRMRWLAASAIALCVAAAPARADTIRVVIPYAPGGALDPIARILVNGWSRLRPGDSIIVENIGGGGGIVGMSTVAKA